MPTLTTAGTAARPGIQGAGHEGGGVHLEATVPATPAATEGSVAKHQTTEIIRPAGDVAPTDPPQMAPLSPYAPPIPHSLAAPTNSCTAPTM